MRHLPKPEKVLSISRYYGGKTRLVRRILPYIQGGEIYVEPFCGMANVFWRKKPHPVEVLNDKDQDIVNVFRCLQDPKLFKELAHRLAWTPYSLAEFCRALELLKTSSDPVERSWAKIVQTCQGFAGMGSCKGSWGRALSGPGGMAGNVRSWRSRLACLRWWHDRLTRVQLDCRDGIEVIQYWDGPETVFYVDPPYPIHTRKAGSEFKYECEMTDDEHQKLVEVLLKCRGRVVLSGYPTPLYRPLEEAGWIVKRYRMACSAAGRVRGSAFRGEGALRKQGDRAYRIECLWINRLAAEESGELGWGLLQGLGMDRGEEDEE